MVYYLNVEVGVLSYHSRLHTRQGSIMKHPSSWELLIYNNGRRLVAVF